MDTARSVPTLMPPSGRCHELLSVERLEERAKALAASSPVAAGHRAGARAVLRRFDDNTAALYRAYRILMEDVRAQQPVTAAGEWILDNFHVLTLRVPPCISTRRRASVRPTPRPPLDAFCCGSPCTKRSKMHGRRAASMPTPPRCRLRSPHGQAGDT